MATAQRSKSPARRKPARARKTTTPATNAPVAEAAAPQSTVITGPWPEADPSVADARDRAADIVDLAHDRVQALAADARTAESHLDTVRSQIADAVREQAGLAEQHARMRNSTQAQLEAAEEAARRIDALTTGQLAAAQRDVDAYRAEADRILTQARAQAQQVADDLVAQARQEAQTLMDVAAADRSAADRERKAAEAELVRAHERAVALGEAADEQLAVRRAQTERLHADAVRAADKVREQAAVYADGQRKAAEKTAARIRATAEELAARTRREAQQLAAALTSDAEQVLSGAREEAARTRTEVQAEVEDLRRTVRREMAEARATTERTAMQVVTVARQEATVIKRDVALLHGLAERELHQAQAQREQAAAEQADRGEQKPARRRWSVRAASAWMWGRAPWAALMAAIGLTASGEYKLAMLAGFGVVSWLLPVCIDIWAATAFHRKKDVRSALAMMIATNVIYHMAERGIVGVRTVDGHHVAEWWLIGLVACIAPVVLWRVHQLIGHAQDEQDATAPDTSGSTPQDGRIGEAGHAPSGDTANRYRTAQDGIGRTTQDGGSTHRPDAHRTPATSGNEETASRTALARTVPATRPRPTVTATTGEGSGAGRPAPSGGVAVLSDEELLAAIRAMPTDPDGCLPPTRVRDTHGCGRPRAIRLMRIAGVLRPEDDPELTTHSS